MQAVANAKAAVVTAKPSDDRVIMPALPLCIATIARRVSFGMFMDSPKTVWLAVVIALLVASCKDAPGADGRYAHGNNYTAGGSRWAP
jgi:hypothetical protein